MKPNLALYVAMATCQACVPGGGGDGPVLDRENRIHYRVILHTSQYTQPAVIATEILTDVWGTNPERWYDDTDTPRYLAEGQPCEVQFTRYSDRQTDVSLYEDSLFPVMYSENLALTPEATGLISQFDNDPDDPLEVGDKLVRVFVMPRLAFRTSLGSVETNTWLGLANSLPSQDGFASVFLASSYIMYLQRFSVFAHEISHLLAPQPGWTDNSTIFTHILTYSEQQSIQRWDWDPTAQTLVYRTPSDQAVRRIVNVTGNSQCDAAWSKSHVRMITESLAP